MTIHLYIQTRHICKGTIQSKLAMRRAVEGRMQAQSRDTVSQEDRLGSS